VKGVDDRVAGVDDRVASVNDTVTCVAATIAVVGERVAGVDDKVAGVGDRMANVDDRVKTLDTRVTAVDDRVRAVDDKVAVVINGMQNHLQLVVNNDQLARSSSPSFIFVVHWSFNILAGNHSPENLRKWLSPSDPSTNHNIACGAHHNGTASWFFNGSVFNQWKSTGSLLWIHGKRAFTSSLPLCCLMASYPIAGSGKSILWFVSPWVFLSGVVDVVCQLHNHRRYRGHVQGRTGIDVLFLL
jgi:hypothetical protein